MKKKVFPQMLINVLVISQNMVESYDFTIALRSNENQALVMYKHVMCRINYDEHVSNLRCK